MKIYCTKWCLTEGIEEFETESDGEDGYVRIHRNGASFDQWISRNHWHCARSDAVEQANRMRRKRIASLRKQLAALESQAFK